MALFSPLDDMLAALQTASVGLTSHLLVSEQEQQAVLDHELCALQHGIFNLGSFAVRDCSESQAFSRVVAQAVPCLLLERLAFRVLYRPEVDQLRPYLLPQYQDLASS